MLRRACCLGGGEVTSTLPSGSSSATNQTDIKHTNKNSWCVITYLSRGSPKKAESKEGPGDRGFLRTGLDMGSCRGHQLNYGKGEKAEVVGEEGLLSCVDRYGPLLIPCFPELAVLHTGKAF